MRCMQNLAHLATENLFLFKFENDEIDQKSYFEYDAIMFLPELW